MFGALALRQRCNIEDSHVAFIERWKVVIQLTYYITFPCPEKHNYRKIGLIQLFRGDKSRVFSNVRVNLILKTFYCFAEISITDKFAQKKCFPQSLTKMSTRGNVAKNNKPRFFYGLYSDKPGVFDQSEHTPDPIYIIINN